MALYLVESTLKEKISDKEEFEGSVEKLKTSLEQNNVNLIEVQVSKDFERVFFIFESESADTLEKALKDEGVAIDLIKEVRIVGKELEEVKKQADKVNYLVEWNLPEDLTMDQYLARKKKNSVHYAEVPEVSFSRTYVCEDMTKCLCFYDAPDEDAVKRAREAVNTPLDSITEINND
ncbi:hypothetical protein GCM10007216_32350 [Thalassobacillus devorans]|uniref:DUF4242 domain-containing protein n=1 Tax=Thalassobacillus devorans TaxID=279813 RepID=A0ABQ1PL81_9BACI|nr:DUF4242 domain-containing protein [Thalassobacillus devorans]NIK30196.1 hypothetical protein [Thalassobacillus devorans]GGC99115.1 hypothetical protein GCM10007216_32350 [Thalassobacillus devorans]